MGWASLSAGLLFAVPVAAAMAAPATLYRIEMVQGQPLLAEDRPLDTGASIVFHRSPGGVLVSVRKADVRRIVATKAPAAPRMLAPGGEIVLGATGGGSAGTAGRPARPARAIAGPLAPGEGKGGTALFNPDRPYRPDWDARQVPGTNLGYPNSPNDYAEGKTLAHPAASAVQTAPGAPPTMPTGSGEVPK
jgi:hypothetical protein